MFKLFGRMKVSTKVLVLALGSIVITAVILATYSISASRVLSGQLSQELLMQKINSDMNSLQYYLQQELGEWQWRSNSLHSSLRGEVSQIPELLDNFAQDLGVMATIFAKKDHDFIRIATNIKQDNGQRAIGTFLGSQSQAYQPMLQGREYIGQAMIIGRPYLTKYLPIVVMGEVIGIVFIGLPQSAINQLIDQNLQATIWWIIFISVGVIVIFGVLILVLTKITLKPLKTLADIAEQVAQLDLTVEIPAKILVKKDEIAFLARSFEVLILAFNRIINQTNQTMMTLKQTAKALGSTANNQLQDAQKLTTQTTQTDASVQNTSAAIEEVTSSAQEVAASAQVIAHNSTELANQNNLTSQKAKSGEELIAIVVEEIRTVGIESSKTVEIIEKLAQSAQKVEEIINAITAIAAQTNLLSLNAAIEAARAGEAGRGFAVVADEVRKLSDESKTAASKITHILHEIAVGTNQAQQASQQVSASTAQANKNAEIIQGHFGEISKMVIENTQKINQLVEIAENQNATTEEISQAMEASARATINIAGQVDEVNRIAQAQNQQSELVESLAKKLEDMVSTLQTMVEQFKL